MIRRLMTITALATSAWAQTEYARAVYLKAKPGMLDKALEVRREYGDKGAAGILAAGDATGYLAMVRVFPSSHEAGHDQVYVYTHAAPPAFRNNPAFLEGTGLTAAEWNAKASVSEQVKLEIWRGIFRQGAIEKGDFVRITQYKPAQGKRAQFRDYLREFEGPMWAEAIKMKARKAWQAWDLLFAPESAPYDFVSIASVGKAEDFYKAPPRQSLFMAAHPGKDYHAYRNLAGSGLSVGSTIYRVETAIRK